MDDWVKETWIEDTAPVPRPDRTRAERLSAITLDEGRVIRRAPEIERERALAITDLLADNYFAPQDLMPGAPPGPYALNLSVAENRLLLEILGPDGARLDRVPLALTPFRRLIRDYFAICESYFEAVKTASPSRIEAIDMGRRGLHDDGATLLRERLDGKIAVDHGTARRLFTLICVLHFR